MALTKSHNRMIAGAVYSIEDYAGANAGEKIAAAIDALPSTGGVIDATGLTGTQTFGSDIFASRSKPFVLRLGNATFETTVSSYTLSLGSNQHIELSGTTLQPDADGEASSSGGNGFITSKVTETTGSITTGTSSLTLASVDGLEEGCLVAIDGSGGITTNSQTTLSSGIDTSTTTIPLADASDLPSTYTVVVGSEIITGSEKSGNSLINVTRGAYGSTAASHTSGDTVSLSPYQRAIVESISGTTVTISGNATTTVTNAKVLFGSTNISVTGTGVFDGRQNRSGSDPSKNLFGIELKLATRCNVTEGLTFKNWDHGGVYLESSWYNSISGRYFGNSRISGGTGANLWVFRNSSFNDIRPIELSDSYVGIFVDDRTSSANLLDGPCNKNNFVCANISASNAALEISGSNKNVAYLGSVQSSASSAIRIATNAQGSTLRSCKENTVYAGHVEGSSAALVLRDASNYVEIGSTDDTVDVGSGSTSFATVKEGTSAANYFGAGITSPTIEYKFVEDGAIRLTSSETSLSANDPIGKIEFYGSDGSSPGAGIKAAIKARASTGTAGGGELMFTVANGTDGLDFDVLNINQVGDLLPQDSGNQTLGGSSNLWDTVYASTGTINTSDENEKQDIRSISAAETAVATALKGQMKAFRFRSAVNKKGDDARIHFGTIAQSVRDAFIAEGLDPNDYGVFCEDIIIAEDGTETSKLGVRYDELFAFIISTL